MTSKYDIKVLDTEKNKIPQKACSKDGTLPKFPFSMVISGRSGSGKSQLLLNILSRDEMYGSYFHCIIVFSPTANDLDDTYSTLNLPKDNFIKDFDRKILENILDNRKNLIKDKGINYVSKYSRVLLIFDDMIAEKQFLESPENLKLFTLLRHYLCSVIILSQSFKKIPRSIRINANFLAIFPSLESEILIMLEEITPSGVTKKDFRNILNYCTSDKYSFLSVNNHADLNKRIKKNLNETINIEDFKNIKTTTKIYKKNKQGYNNLF